MASLTASVRPRFIDDIERPRGVAAFLPIRAALVDVVEAEPVV